jgi:hypothetical protein
VGYLLHAVVAREHALAEGGLGLERRQPLRRGFALRSARPSALDLGGEALEPFVYLSAPVLAYLERVSHVAPVVYLEADFHGGGTPPGRPPWRSQPVRAPPVSASRSASFRRRRGRRRPVWHTACA